MSDGYLHLSRSIAEGRATETIPLWSADILHAVAEGRRELRAAVHPLGFTCLPVIREGRYGVCVHAWLPGQPRASPTTSPVHAHSWDLVSYVLFGRLRNDLPHVVGAKPGARDVWRVLEIHSRGGTDDIVPTPRLVHRESGESVLIVRNDVYTLPAGTFHSSIVDPTEPTVTVMLASTVADSADLCLGSPSTQAHRIRRNRSGQAETAALARTIIERYWRPR
jgi:hypothetical protein